MTSSDYESSSRKYEREARITRQRLADSLEELSDRLTPGQVLDEMLTYATAGGGTFFRALANAARENPVPSLLVGAGCMMFMSEKTGLSRYMTGGNSTRGTSSGAQAQERTSSGAGSARRAMGAAATAVESVKSGIETASGFASAKASTLAEGVKQGAETLRNTISDTSQRMAQAVGETVQEYSSAVGEQISDKVEGTRRQAASAASQVKDKVLSFTNEQPLLFAAMGLAVGALIAAILPSTETENQIMGESSDAIKKAAGEVASEGYGTAKAAAITVVREAKTAAERQGMTPSGAADIARSMGEKIVQVVTESAAAGSPDNPDLPRRDKT